MNSRSPRLVGGLLVAFGAISLIFGTVSVDAAQHPVGLGTVDSFAVLASETVTNNGSTVIDGNVGVSPGTAIEGFPPGIVQGSIHSADAIADQAQADTTTAYNDAAGRTPFTSVATELGGTTLTPGVYRNVTLGLTGTLTLDAEGDPNATFIFQTEETLITAPDSQVNVINGAQACNVFWQVGSAATLDTGTQFIGTVLALVSITANTGATVQGRLLARTGAVTLDTNTITAASCSPTTSTTSTPTTSTTSTPTTSTTSTTTGPTTSTTSTPTTSTTSTTTGPTTPTTSTTTGPTTDTSPDTTGDASGTTTTVGPGDFDRTTTVEVPVGVESTTTTTMTSLPRTGSSLTATSIGGALMLLVGVAIVRRAEAIRAR